MAKATCTPARFDEEVDEHLDRIEAQVDRMDDKLAQIMRLVAARSGVQDYPPAARAEAKPPADLSPEHIAKLVDELPPALAEEINATAKAAEELAWMADHVLGRWEAIEAALSEGVCSAEVDNGGDLVQAVEGRTRAHVIEEVLNALSLLGRLPEDDHLEVIQGHSVEPLSRARARFLEGLVRLNIATSLTVLVDERTAEAVKWLLRPEVPEDEAGQDVIDAVVMAARGRPRHLIPAGSPQLLGTS